MMCCANCTSIEAIQSTILEDHRLKYELFTAVLSISHMITRAYLKSLVRMGPAAVHFPMQHPPQSL